MPEVPRYADLPEEFLTKLNTFTYGGYMLFYFDAQGEPHVETQFNEPVDAIALKKFALDILEALDVLSKRRLTQELDHATEETGPGEEEV